MLTFLVMKREVPLLAALEVTAIGTQSMLVKISWEQRSNSRASLNLFSNLRTSKTKQTKRLKKS